MSTIFVPKRINDLFQLQEPRHQFSTLGAARGGGVGGGGADALNVAPPPPRTSPAAPLRPPPPQSPVQLVEEGVGLRLPLYLISDGIQDGVLLRHLLRLDDDELPLRLRHAQAGNLLLHGLRLFLLLLLLILILLLRLRQVWRETCNDAGDAASLDLRLDLKAPLRRRGFRTHTNDGTVDVNGQPALKASTGNWRACFFVLGVQFSECSAFFAISKNLVTYLTIERAPRRQYRCGEECVHLGMFVLTVSTTLPWMMQSSNHREIHRATVYVGLYLTALGNGGIKPCTSTFGADQFDITDPSERVKKGSFFNWFYFLTSIGSLLSTSVIVWVQDNVGWGIGFAIPMILTSLSFMVFIASRRIYRYMSIGESPMTRASRIFGKGCHCITIDTGEERRGGKPMEAMRAVSCRRGKDAATSVPCMGILGGLLHGHGTDVIEQGMAMDNHVGQFIVPPASLTSFNVVTTLISAPAYVVMGVGEVFTVIGTLELFYDRAPDKMRSMSTAFAQLAILNSAVLGVVASATMWIPDKMRSMSTAFAQLAILNSAVLGVVASATMWIPEDLDDGHLDYFLWSTQCAESATVYNLLYEVQL
ncbi:hypothetical protein D1007_34549 [Hordeum vulgare]|nr:hypothetical protein D1007_34549 [Hordeum vulgare]